MLAWLWKRLSDGGPQVTVSGRALRRFPEREVERLLRARILSERRKADSWSVCVHCDCWLDARPVRAVGDQFLACCPRNVAADEVLEPDDLRRFGIDVDRLAGALAASGGLTGSTTRIGDGIWLLGIGPTGRGIVLCRDPDLLEAPGAILAIKAAAGSAPVTVIANAFAANATLRLQEAGIDARQLPEVIRIGTGGREQLRLDQVPASAGAIRLVVSRGAQSAVLDGRRLELPMQMFVLFRMFTEQLTERDPVLRSQQIETRLAREPREIIRDLRRALVACGLTEEAAEALIRTVRGRGYRLGLQPSEVAIED